jgi:hypothetical protein
LDCSWDLWIDVNNDGVRELELSVVNWKFDYEEERSVDLNQSINYYNYLYLYEI